MSRFNDVQAVLSEFAADNGLAGICLDDHGQVSLNVGPLEVSFMCEVEPVGILWIFADLGDVPDDKEATAYLLNLAFVAWLSDSITIAVESGRRRGLGYAAIPVSGLDAKGLSTTFERLVKAAMEIRERLAARDFSGLEHLAKAAADPGS